MTLNLFEETLCRKKKGGNSTVKPPFLQGRLWRKHSWRLTLLWNLPLPLAEQTESVFTRVEVVSSLMARTPALKKSIEEKNVFCFLANQQVLFGWLTLQQFLLKNESETHHRLLLLYLHPQGNDCGWRLKWFNKQNNNFQCTSSTKI